MLYTPTQLRGDSNSTPPPTYSIGPSPDLYLKGPFSSEVDALEEVGDLGYKIYFSHLSAAIPVWTWSPAGWLRHQYSPVESTLNVEEPKVPEETPDNFTLSEDQAAAWSKLIAWSTSKHSIFVLRGYAGTGKTFMLRKLLDVFPDAVFTASTNKAAKELGHSVGVTAKTTYSALGLVLSQAEDKLVLTQRTSPPYYPTGTVIVVDESSMVGSQLQDALLESTSRGMRVVYVGDPAQLPPVGEVRSPVWKLDLPESCKSTLTKVMRFDNQLLTLATDLRSCIKNKNWETPIETDHDELHGVWKWKSQQSWKRALLSRLNSVEDCLETKVIAWRNKTVNEYNGIIRSHLGFKKLYEPGDLMLIGGPIEEKGTFIAHTDDEFVVTDVSLSQVSTPADVDFQVYRIEATQVDGLWTLVLNVPVRQPDLDKLLSKLAGDARSTKSKYDRTRAWQLFWRTNAMFHKVRYSYAITAHRAQGSTMKNVWLDQSDILSNSTPSEAFRCLYVGATRPTTQLHTY